MDTHYGKYSGALAALTERWTLDGSAGEDSYVNSEWGEGTELFLGPFELSWDEGRYLMGEDFECSLEEVDALAAEIRSARAILHAWDSQGFIYGDSLATLEAVEDVRANIERANLEAEAEEAIEPTYPANPCPTCGEPMLGMHYHEAAGEDEAE